MRQIRQDVLGGPEVLKLTEIEVPEPRPTEIRVRVHAAGVNPIDWNTRKLGVFLGEPPFSVGWDVAGVVDSIGAGVTRFKPGDKVLGMPWFPREAGGYSDYVCGPSRQFVAKPASLTFVEAAGLPLAGLTAWQTLVDVAKLEPGQRVLVTAASGGVGHFAVQIAKARGAYVIATGRDEKRAFLARIGADEVIDYTTTDIATATGGIDVALCLAGDVDSVLSTIRPGGLFIAAAAGAGPPEVEKAHSCGLRGTNFLVEPDSVGLEGLAALADHGQLTVHVEKTFPLEQAAEAHELGEEGRTKGKLVLEVA
jgi:NADPH:quinone reductase-like Zn-dependent oxidoreductase